MDNQQGQPLPYQPPQQPWQPSTQYPPYQQPSPWQQPPQYPQQWQQPYPPQQPYYPPPMMQPPPRAPRKRHTWLWIVLGIIALLLFACIGASSLAGKSTQPTTSTSSSTSATQASSNPTTTSNAPANTIGKPVVVDNDWTVTLNSVKTSQGSEFDHPKAGDILFVVNVTLKNTSGSTQAASSLVQWSLKDNTGQTYNQDIIFGKGPDGTIASGGVIRGNIAYEVPKSVHSFTLQFVPGLGSSDLAEWAVSI